jgi:hypothetical protein
MRRAVTDFQLIRYIDSTQCELTPSAAHVGMRSRSTSWKSSASMARTCGSANYASACSADSAQRESEHLHEQPARDAVLKSPTETKLSAVGPLWVYVNRMAG